MPIDKHRLISWQDGLRRHWLLSYYQVKPEQSGNWLGRPGVWHCRQICIIILPLLEQSEKQINLIYYFWPWQRVPHFSLFKQGWAGVSFRELAKASWECMSGDRSWVFAQERCQTPPPLLLLRPLPQHPPPNPTSPIFESIPAEVWPLLYTQGNANPSGLCSNTRREDVKALQTSDRPNRAPYSQNTRRLKPWMQKVDKCKVAEVTADNSMHKNPNICVEPNSNVILYPLQHRSNFPTRYCNVILQV